MRALITLFVAAALTAAAPAVAGAAHSCAPPPPGSSQVTTGPRSTPAGPAEARGGPDHAGITFGESYLFADGNPQGGYVYGQVAVTGPVVGPYPVFYGPEFRIGGGPGQTGNCVENYR